jgi:WD40 repeat protein
MQTTLRIPGHDDDVNAVVFLDDSSNLIASGSDDTLIKVSHVSEILAPWIKLLARDTS